MRHLIRAKARAVVHDCEVSRRDGTNGDGHRDDVEVVPRPACYTVVENCAGNRVAQGPVPKVELKQKDNTYKDYPITVTIRISDMFFWVPVKYARILVYIDRVPYFH